MKTRNLFALSAMILVLGVAASRGQGQPSGGPGRGFGGPNFDPAQFQQQMQEAVLNNCREQLEIKDDDEWKVIGGQIKKVLDAQTQVGLGGGANLLRSAFRARNNGQDTTGGGQRRMMTAGAMFGQTEPEMDALQKLIDAKASNEALKAAMTKVMDSRKAKEAKLDEARTELRKLLTVRQEAIGLSLGLF